MVKQTAGEINSVSLHRNFAEINDDVLFRSKCGVGKTKLSLRDRSTCYSCCTLCHRGLVDSSFKYHLMSAKNNGITKEEIAEIITHSAFYTGMVKSLGQLSTMAKEVWTEE